MTNEEINIAIEEHLGVPEGKATSIICPLCWGSGSFGKGRNDCNECQGTGRVMPRYYGKNYSGCLNAMHEAVSCFDWETAQEYERVLWALVRYEECCMEKPRPVNFAAMNATAKQRAEAFLRAVGKWKEET